MASLAGGRVCGAVRFELTEPPTGAGSCHCRRCRRRSGTAWATDATVAPGTVRAVQACDEDPGVRPRWRRWLASAAPWEQVPDDGEHFAGRRP